MGSGFDVLAQAGAQNAIDRAREAEQQRIASRNSTGALLLSAINTKLPATDDPAYQDALNHREDLMKQFIALNSPQEHATFADRLHGLIFGKNEPPPQPQPAAPPQQPQALDALGVPYGGPQDQTPQPPVGVHPFAPHPATGRIQQGLDALQQHLSAFAHPAVKPNPALQNIDFEGLAKEYKSPAETQAELWSNKEDIRQQNRLEAIDQRYKDMANLRKQIGTGTTVQKAAYNTAARELGFSGFDDPKINADQFDAIAQRAKTSLAPLPKYQEKVIDGNIYVFDPTKGVNRLIGSFDSVTVHHDMKPVTLPDGSTYLAPVTTYTEKKSGKPIVDETTGQPLQVQGQEPTSSAAPVSPPAAAGSSIGQAQASATPAGPVSSAAPVNPGARAPGTKPQGGAKKKAAPTSAAAPTNPMLPKGAIPFGGKPNAMIQADKARYQKAAEDADAKNVAYKSAQIAMKSPTPSSDQELIYSWVRTNVQGAGRMTQAEFKQAASTGSLPQKAQNWWSMAKSGLLAPEIRNMMFADIERGTKQTQLEAETLRNLLSNDMNPGSAPVSTAAPEMPDTTPVKKYNPATGKLE
jgi:hypothetical protein